MDSIISTFHIDWKIIIAQAVNFAVVFVVLYIYALKPLSKLMKERGEKISQGLTHAKENAELLKQTNIAHEEMLTKARSEADTIFKNAKKEADLKKVDMMEATKKEVAVMIENGKKSLEAEKSKMVEEAKKEIVNLTILATEKLLGQKVDAHGDHHAIKDLGSVK